MTLSEIFRLVVSLSLMGSLLTLGILLIKLLFRQKLSANWHYYIWLVLILRLLIPFTPQSSFSVFNFLPHYPTKTSLVQVFREAPTFIPPLKSDNTPNSLPESNLTVDPRTSANPSPKTDSIGVGFSTLAIIWLTGVLAILTYILLVNGGLFLKLKKHPTCDAKDIIEILEESKTRLKVHSKVSVIYDVGLRSPALFGLRQPKIIISPQIIAKLSQEELQFIFLHEVSHLKRQDLLVNTLVTITQVIYWFNPIIWYALHQMKQDCEIACDATALATVQAGEHKRYGQTIIDLMQLLSKPHWTPGTIGFMSKFNTRRILMITSFKKTTKKWSIAALALTLVVGCSSLTNPLNPTDNNLSQKGVPTTTSQQNSSADSSSPPANSSSNSNSNNISINPSQIAPPTQPTASAKTLLLNMMQLARQGKVINSDFPLKTTFDVVEKVWGPADKTDYVGAAKGRFATFSSHKVVFGINKGEQIFETRSFDSRLGSVSLANVKLVFGTPAYATKYNGQEIIGYTAGSEFKLEMIFPQPTTSIPDPVMDHYNVLYPRGTVNLMADDPGRQW